MSRILLLPLLVFAIGLNGSSPGARLSAQSQELPLKAQTTAAALADLGKAFKELERSFPNEKTLLSDISDCLMWLKTFLKPEEPEEYRLHLTQEAALLLTASKTPKTSLAIIRAITDDLKAKRDDCLSHSHGRLVPVEVQTLRNGAPEHGWRIRYTWIPTKGKAANEMWFPGPSSPSNRPLPPGSYAVVAQKQVEGKTVAVDGGTIPVGGDDNVVWKIALP
jgi:hypothetical protein